MLKPVFPVVDYIINHDYIAEYFCVNKDKPELSCDGKCYLAQQLAEEKDEKRKNLPAINLKEYPIGFVEFVSIYINNFNTIIKKTFPEKVTEIQTFHQKVFHPPCCWFLYT